MIIIDNVALRADRISGMRIVQDTIYVQMIGEADERIFDFPSGAGVKTKFARLIELWELDLKELLGRGHGT